MLSNHKCDAGGKADGSVVFVLQPGFFRVIRSSANYRYQQMPDKIETLAYLNLGLQFGLVRSKIVQGVQ